jgi:ABC-type amino acid transport system permease subunit
VTNASAASRRKSWLGWCLALAVWFLIRNLLVNQERLGVPMSFRFLDGPAGFQLSFAAISVTLDSPISRILLVGALNTLLAAAITAVLATVSAWSSASRGSPTTG